MNRRLLLLLPISLLLMLLQPLTTGCHEPREPHLLLQADSLCSSRPDSAIQLLDSLTPTLEHSPQHTRMYHSMLLIKAVDKARQRHTTDTLILPIVTYYERHRSLGHLPEAYYYAGRVYADLNNAPKALDYFQKAKEINTDKNLLRVILSQMGELFLFQGLYTKALQIYKEYHTVAIQTGHAFGKFNSLCKIATTFTGLHNADSATYYYYKAAEVAADDEMKEQVAYKLMSLYVQKKEYDKAIEQLNHINISQARKKSYKCATLAGLYIATEQWDSAAFYCNHNLRFNSVWAQEEAHLRLAIICEKQQKTKEALEHLRQYHHWNDSIKDMTQTETLGKMNALYNHQLHERQNMKLQQKVTMQRASIYGIAIILCLVTAISLYTIYRKKAKNHVLSIQLQKMNADRDNLIEQLDSLTATNKQSEEMIKQLIAEKANQNKTTKSMLHEIPVIKKFFAAKDFTDITEEDWQSLQQAIDYAYHNFTAKLYCIHQLNQTELHICLLTKLGLTPTRISLLTARSKSTITSARKALSKKLIKYSDSEKDFDSFIKNFE